MTQDAIRIVSLDRVKENVIVHFSNGLSVLYHAQFLFDVRDADNNIPLPAEAEESEA